MNRGLTSVQDGRIGRHCAFSHNQKDDKNKYQNERQLELTETKQCGSLTTKELKKKHSSRPVGGAETGGRVERTPSKAAAGRPGKVVAGELGGSTFRCG